MATQTEAFRGRLSLARAHCKLAIPTAQPTACVSQSCPAYTRKEGLGQRRHLSLLEYNCFILSNKGTCPLNPVKKPGQVMVTKSDNFFRLTICVEHDCWQVIADNFSYEAWKSTFLEFQHCKQWVIAFFSCCARCKTYFLLRVLGLAWKGDSAGSSNPFNWFDSLEKMLS